MVKFQIEHSVTGSIDARWTYSSNSLLQPLPAAGITKLSEPIQYRTHWNKQPQAMGPHRTAYYGPLAGPDVAVHSVSHGMTTLFRDCAFGPLCCALPRRNSLEVCG
jgi:hypothetical protein